MILAEFGPLGIAACALLGVVLVYAFGYVIGYADGQANGTSDAAEWYGRKRREGKRK